MAVLQCLAEGRLVDDPAARGIHDPRAGLDHAELLLADQTLGLGRARQMDRHEVGLHEERLERRHDLDAHLLGALGAHVRVERDHAHPEAGRARGDERSDAAEPDQADRLSGQLDALPPRALPPAVDQIGVRLRDVARLREQQRECLFGRRDDVGLRRVHHHHAAPRRFLDVDVVQTDAGARDDLEVGRRREDRRGHLRGAPDHEGVVGRNLRGKIALREVGAHVYLEVLAQQLEALFRQGLGHQDPHRLSALPETPARLRPPRRRASPDSPAARASSPGPPARG